MPYEDRLGRFCGFLNIEEKENSGFFSRRYFILDKANERFQYYMDNPTNLSFSSRGPVGEVNLHYISMVSDGHDLRPKIQFCFVINSAGQQLCLQAEDENDMRKWIDILNNASKITVPKREIKPVCSSPKEWHSGDKAEIGYTAEIAGGVVCKFALPTNEDSGSDSTDDEEHSRYREMSDLGPIFKRGYCVKQGAVRKNWKRRYFVLHEDGLSYFKSEQSKRPLRTISKNDILDVRESEGIHSNRDNLIDIITSKRIFYVQCDSKADLASWISALKKMISYQKSKEKKSKEGASTLPPGADLPSDQQSKAFWV
ncbi:hypothetical protein ScPMuIL_006421 [Solemya velum]